MSHNHRPERFRPVELDVALGMLDDRRREAADRRKAREGLTPRPVGRGWRILRPVHVSREPREVPVTLRPAAKTADGSGERS